MELYLSVADRLLVCSFISTDAASAYAKWEYIQKERRCVHDDGDAPALWDFPWENAIGSTP